jgi:hypothetical protein
VHGFGPRVRRAFVWCSIYEQLFEYRTQTLVLKEMRVKIVAKTLAVVEVAARTGLTRAVARRYLLTLEELGYVVQREPEFTLTPRVLDLGASPISPRSISTTSPSHLWRKQRTGCGSRTPWRCWTGMTRSMPRAYRRGGS